MTKISKIFALALAISFVPPAPGLFAEYPVEKLLCGKKIPLKAKEYDVLPEAEIGEDFRARFKNDSIHGSYEVTGLEKLATRLQEIPVVEALRVRSAGGEAAEGASDKLSETGRGFVLIATHPLKTGKNVGVATGKLFKSTGKVFSRKKQKAVKKVPLRQKLFQGAKRDLANKIGVDVYSDNLYLQKELNRMAKGRVGGQTALGVVQFFIPVTLIGSIAMTASGVSAGADRVANTKDPWELYDINLKAFKEMGIEEKEADRLLLENAFFNPRQQTKLRFFLEAIRQAEGWKELFGYAVPAGELEARNLLLAMEMLVMVEEKNKSIESAGVRDGIVYAKFGKEGYVFLAFDLFPLNDRTREVISRIRELRGNELPSNVTVMSLGKVEPDAKSAMETSGLRVKDCVFFTEGDFSFQKMSSESAGA